MNFKTALNESLDEIALLKLQIEQQDLKLNHLEQGIKKYCFHWDSYFSNKIVGNPPIIQDLKDLIK